MRMEKVFLSPRFVSRLGYTRKSRVSEFLDAATIWQPIIIHLKRPSESKRFLQNSTQCRSSKRTQWTTIRRPAISDIHRSQPNDRMINWDLIFANNIDTHSRLVIVSTVCEVLKHLPSSQRFQIETFNGVAQNSVTERPKRLARALGAP